LGRGGKRGEIRERRGGGGRKGRGIIVVPQDSLLAAVPSTGV